MRSFSLFSTLSGRVLIFLLALGTRFCMLKSVLIIGVFVFGWMFYFIGILQQFITLALTVLMVWTILLAVMEVDC